MQWEGSVICPNWKPIENHFDRAQIVCTIQARSRPTHVHIVIGYI